jgi:hypothetical protein
MGGIFVTHSGGGSGCVNDALQLPYLASLCELTNQMCPALAAQHRTGMEPGQKLARAPGAFAPVSDAVASVLFRKSGEVPNDSGIVTEECCLVPQA